MMFGSAVEKFAKYYGVKQQCIEAGWTPLSGSPAEEEGKATPGRKLLEALMVRAIYAIPLIRDMQKSAPVQQKLHERNMLSPVQWKSFQIADGTVRREIEEVQYEALELMTLDEWKAKVGGEVFQVAGAEYMKIEQRQKQMAAQMQAQKDGGAAPGAGDAGSSLSPTSSSGSPGSAPNQPQISLSQERIPCVLTPEGWRPLNPEAYMRMSKEQTNIVKFKPGTVALTPDRLPIIADGDGFMQLAMPQQLGAMKYPVGIVALTPDRIPLISASDGIMRPMSEEQLMKTTFPKSTVVNYRGSPHMANDQGKMEPMTLEQFKGTKLPKGQMVIFQGTSYMGGPSGSPVAITVPQFLGMKFPPGQIILGPLENGSMGPYKVQPDGRPVPLSPEEIARLKAAKEEQEAKNKAREEQDVKNKAAASAAKAIADADKAAKELMQMEDKEKNVSSAEKKKNK